MPVLAAVLAGGRGRRMGGAKPIADLGGRPLIAYPLAALRAAGLDAVVVARSGTPLPALDVAVLLDPPGPTHPFAGVLTALDHAGGPVLAVGADMPFLNPRMLRRVAAIDAPLAVCRAGDVLQPLCARYTPGLRDTLLAAVEAGAPMRATLAGLDPVVIDVDPDEVANVNTPEQLAAAAVRLCG